MEVILLPEEVEYIFAVFAEDETPDLEESNCPVEQIN